MLPVFAIESKDLVLIAGCYKSGIPEIGYAKLSVKLVILIEQAIESVDLLQSYRSN